MYSLINNNITEAAAEPIITKKPPGEALMNEVTDQVVLYKAPDGSISINVKLQGETVWLSLNQMADLFERDKSVISRHLRNVYATGELQRDSTVAFFATVQTEGGRQIERKIEYFNLDTIISVGYRVNSKRGTQFRIWATGVLRNHILKGYTVNEHRLLELNQAICLITNIAERRELTGDEATALLRVVGGDYSYALDLKNHPFIDGNKRIADNAFVAITLLIAESHPEEKDILTRVVVNLINRRNI